MPTTKLKSAEEWREYWWSKHHGGMSDLAKLIQLNALEAAVEIVQQRKDDRYTEDCNPLHVCGDVIREILTLIEELKNPPTFP